MKGFNVARIMCVSLCMATTLAIELELRKMRSWMYDRYDVNVRGILGSGRRDVREWDTGKKREVDRGRAGVRSE